MNNSFEFPSTQGMCSMWSNDVYTGGQNKVMKCFTYVQYSKEKINRIRHELTVEIKFY